jgi:hypothetical protein
VSSATASTGTVFRRPGAAALPLLALVDAGGQGCDHGGSRGQGAPKRGTSLGTAGRIVGLRVLQTAPRGEGVAAATSGLAEGLASCWAAEGRRGLARGLWATWVREVTTTEHTNTQTDTCTHITRAAHGKVGTTICAFLPWTSGHDDRSARARVVVNARIECVLLLPALALAHCWWLSLPGDVLVLPCRVLRAAALRRGPALARSRPCSDA